VSVVVPAFNAGRFLRLALQSVLSQTYSPLECIVVDDGSTDGTGEVARGFGDRVLLLRTERVGVSSARNAGARAGTGAVLAFLDADDMWLPRKLELQMAIVREHTDLGCVYCGLHLIDGEGAFIGKMRPAPGDVALRNTLLLERPYMSIVTAVVPRHVFEAVGGFDERLSTAADHELACRIAMRWPVRGVDEPLYMWRQHGTGQMHRDPKRTERDALISFETLFSDPALPGPMRELRRRALANLYISVAGGHIGRGEQLPALRCIAKSLVLAPGRALAAADRLTRPGGPEGLHDDVS